MDDQLFPWSDILSNRVIILTALPSSYNTKAFAYKLLLLLLFFLLLLYFIVFRALKINTDEFGKKWGTLAYEKKLKINSSLKSPSEFMEVMRTKLNFHPVQIIGENAHVTNRKDQTELLP